MTTTIRNSEPDVWLCVCFFVRIWRCLKCIATGRGSSLYIYSRRKRGGKHLLAPFSRTAYGIVSLMGPSRRRIPQHISLHTDDSQQSIRFDTRHSDVILIVPFLLLYQKTKKIKILARIGFMCQGGGKGFDLTPCGGRGWAQKKTVLFWSANNILWTMMRF